MAALDGTTTLKVEIVAETRVLYLPDQVGRPPAAGAERVRAL
jgi:hypothetical protein